MANLVNFCGYRLEHFRGEGNTGKPIYTSVTASDSTELNKLGYITLAETTQNTGWGYGALYAGFIDATGASTKISAGWISFEANIFNQVSNTEADLTQYAAMVLRSSTNNTYIQLKPVASNPYQFRIIMCTSLTDSTTYIDTNIRITVPYTTTNTNNGTVYNASTQRYSINIVGGGTTSGKIAAYVNGELMGTWTGDLSSYLDFDQISFHKCAPSNNTNLYYCFVTNYETRYSYLSYQTGSKVGSEKDWLGDFSTFNNYPVNYYQIGGLYATASNQSVTFGFNSTFTEQSGYVPSAVVYSSDLITDSDSTVATVAGIVKNVTSDTIETSYNQSPNSNGSCLVWYYGNDPVTSSDWTLANINAYEFGMTRTE